MDLQQRLQAYRAYARKTARMAKDTSSSIMRRRMMAVAKNWEALAAQEIEAESRKNGEHGVFPRLENDARERRATCNPKRGRSPALSIAAKPSRGRESRAFKTMAPARPEIRRRK